MKTPAEEYSKVFAEMRVGWKARKDCKDRITGLNLGGELTFHKISKLSILNISRHGQNPILFCHNIILL